MHTSRSSSPSGLNSWGIPALGAGIALSGLLALSPLLDGDVWWHLATGRWIAQGHGIPRTDPFTYTALGRPWITHEWLSALLFHALHRLGGIELLVIFKAAVATLAVALSAAAGLIAPGPQSPDADQRPSHPRGADPRAFGQARLALERLPGAAAGALLAALLIAPRAFARPHMLTALFLASLLLLLRMESVTGRRRWRFLTAPLFLAWANLHSGFVLGFGLWGLYYVGEAFTDRLHPGASSRPEGREPRPGGARRERETHRGSAWNERAPRSAFAWRERGLALLLAFAASLVNPHFLHAHLYPFQLLAREEVRANIVELRSVFHPDYRGALFIKALIASALAALLLLIDARRRILVSLLLPALFFALLAAAALRGVAEYAVLLPALLAAHAGGLARRRRLASAVSAGVIAIAIAGAAQACSGGMSLGREARLKIGLRPDPAGLPVAAARLLAETRPAGRMFNLLSHGGYLIHELGPETKVFIDGRLDIFPPGFLSDYTRMLDTGAGWEELVARQDITIAVVNHIPNYERDRGVRALLRADPAWVCVLAGDHTLVYARRVPENDELLRRYGLGFDPSARREDFIGGFVSRASPDEVARTLAALENMRRIAPEEIAPALFAGQILDRTGRNAAAIGPLREALRHDPRSPALRLFLAEALERADSLEPARAEVREILKGEPRHAPALALLGLVEYRAEDFPAAARALEQAESAAPMDPLVQIRLGAVKAQTGDYTEARRHLQRALALRPGDPAALRNLEALNILERQARAGETGSGDPPRPAP
ncbi:MAG: tetratricopeptide repeat protein [Candidatus Eisenbacteria bacterium]